MSNRWFRKPGGSGETPSAWTRLWARLFEPVDGASLVFARIAFGTLMAWESYRYLLLGRVWTKWAAPPTLISWPGFEWVPRLAPDGMYLLFFAMGLCALCVAAGFCHRVAALLYGVAWAYLIVIAMAFFNNHYYLTALLGGLWALVPANRMLSVDARLRPSLRSETVPAWSLWLLRTQMGIVYFYGGIAKIHVDWMLGYPMRSWLPDVGGLPVLGEVFEWGWSAVVMSWSGLCLDLFAVPALLWRRTRRFAFAALVFFHLWNSQLFEIGVFPWLAITLTTLFLDPSWPRRIFNWPRRSVETPAPPFRWTTGKRALAGFLSLYLFVQFTLPLRHYFYEGDANWTDEDYYFSWRMMLRKKRGHLGYVLTDSETGESWLVDPRDDIGSIQYRRFVGDATMIHLYAQRLARLAQQEGHERVTVRAVGEVSLNDREPEPLIDPLFDLASAEPMRFGTAPWILPLTKPLGLEWISDADDTWFEKSGTARPTDATDDVEQERVWEFE